MDTLSKSTFKQQIQPSFFSFHHSRPLHFSKPTSISFPKPPIQTLIIKSSSKNSISKSIAENPKTKTKSLNPFTLLKTPITVAVTTAAIFLAGISHKPLPAIATTAPPAVEEISSEISDEEREKKLEEFVAENPDNVLVLKSLMEVRIKNKKLAKAVEVLNRLIELEPEEKEWMLLRAHMYTYMGETEMAKTGFEEIIEKDPVRAEAYHGLVMAVSQGEEGGAELDVVADRIKLAIEKCKKENKKDEVRDFKLLVAQIRVIDGNYDEALRIYEELVKEEPRDFRPYLCQGIIYTLLRKKDEAEKQFEKYKRLVPQGHPYAQYFDENMLATKVFSQMAENERVKVGDRG
ncbi:protein SLOW GREEN 1, chloroplastic-like [Silene latifolia]|uniref:protein SLOW GREEN 1, chloroplastic-like n=1 Tax=Silene latifolia TaxID=37657 RepID=UPI003D782D13